jgi:hypothetical protein
MLRWILHQVFRAWTTGTLVRSRHTDAAAVDLPRRRGDGLQQRVQLLGVGRELLESGDVDQVVGVDVEDAGHIEERGLEDRSLVRAGPLEGG